MPVATCRKTADPRRGTATVELAVLLPLLVFLFLITVDFGRVFYYTLTIDNCARNGALYACGAANSQNPYPDIPTATIADGTNLSPPLTPSDVTVTNGTDADGNSTVTVTVNYTFQTIVTYPGIPNTVNIVRSSEMRVAP